jgi:hypothetical protein
MKPRGWGCCKNQNDYSRTSLEVESGNKERSSQAGPRAGVGGENKMNSAILPQGFRSMHEWISYSIFELKLEAEGNQQMADRIVVDERLHPDRILAAQMARANFLSFKQRCLDQIRGLEEKLEAEKRKAANINHTTEAVPKYPRLNGG